MKHIAKLSAAVSAFAAIPAVAGGSADLGYRHHPTISPAEVVDSAGAQVGLWFPDILGDDEYLVHTIGKITFIAEVRNTGIKGDPIANLYYASSDCSGSPFIQEVPGEDFGGDLQRLTIPYQETFSGISEQTGAGTNPLYYADNTSIYKPMTVCASKGANEVCNPISGCESINVYPALTWDWSGYVQPFLFR